MDNLRSRLDALAEEKYRDFSSRLLPGTSDILGVRLPLLRKIAAEIARSDWRSYLDSASDDTFEEIMLQGMVIGCAPAQPEETLRLTALFLPKITNWSLCDSFCAGFKLPKTHPGLVWDFLKPCLADSRPYFIRFGLVMLLFYYIDEEHLEEILGWINRISHEDYYVKMAAAWCLSICFVKLPERVMPFLLKNDLDDFTYNKALQKITESRCADDETKAVIRRMKR